MMDIGKLKNNYKFYEGFEGETEIILSILDHREFNLHIWEGYIDEIFSNALLNQQKWIGFTRDYQEDDGAFGDMEEHNIDAKEYLEDIKTYYNFPLSKECNEICNLICEFLEFVLDNNYIATLYVS
jgi:hypothetical protein